MKTMISMLLLIIISSSITLSQNINIEGKVISGKSGKPIFGANILLNDAIGTSSGANGKFTLKNVSIGDLMIKISFRL